MKAVDTNDGLFKIDASDIPIRLIHVNGDKFHPVTFLWVDLIEIKAQMVLSSAGKDIQNPVLIEVVEDTGELTVLEIVQLRIDFIDTDRFRKRNPGNMCMGIEDAGHGLSGNAGELADTFECQFRILQKFHDAVDHLIKSLLPVRDDSGLVGE